MSETLWEELGRLEREARARRGPLTPEQQATAGLTFARCWHEGHAIPRAPVFRIPPEEPRPRRRPLWRRLLRR